MEPLRGGLECRSARLGSRKSASVMRRKPPTGAGGRVRGRLPCHRLLAGGGGLVPRIARAVGVRLKACSWHRRHLRTLIGVRLKSALVAARATSHFDLDSVSGSVLQEVMKTSFSLGLALGGGGRKGLEQGWSKAGARTLHRFCVNKTF